MSRLTTRFTLQLPDYWTPEQALAVFELLHELTEQVWQCYQVPIAELTRLDRQGGDISQLDLFDFDDETPF